MSHYPILQTKLYIPPTRPELVSRPRLMEQLNDGLPRQSTSLSAGRFARKLTLISAPAGYGKTTLVSKWVQVMGAVTPPIAAAWLSLDGGDNDLTRFLTYLVAALQTLALPGPPSPAGSIGQGVLGLLQFPGAADATTPPPTESILTALLNDITTIPDNFVLVLDDYHVIDSQAVDASTSVDGALAFLLEHLPPQMHLVIATREDPHLPLARLRVRGQLTEVRVTDLRFTPSEAAGFLNQVMGLNLSAEEIAALEARTEGWIAGLQMAALALQGLAGQGLAAQGTLTMKGRADTASFIQAFTGSHRFVMDYLVEEILQQQPEPVRSFLLQTSILDRLCGPLCDAVRFGIAAASGRQQDGRGILEALERGNLFVVPLDDKRQWYRYHHLFADVLHAHLMEEQRDQVPALHLRASEWYQQNGLPSAAFRHALAADDFGRAAGVAELAWQAMDDSFQSTIWLGWVKKLPDELIRSRPVLSTQLAWALWLSGELEASEARLRDAEQWLDPLGDVSAPPEGAADGTCPELPPGPVEGQSRRTCPELPPEPVEGRNRRMVVVDEEQFQALPARIAVARANNAQAQGDLSAAVKYSELALKLTPEKDLLGRAQATASLGFTYWASGDLEAAHSAMAGWIDSMQTTGNIVFAIASTFALADIMIAQGRLRDAIRVYQQSLQLASDQDEHVQRVTAHLYLGLAMLYHEMGDQEAAAHHLRRGKELGEQSTLPDWPYRWCLAQAQRKESGRDLDAALDLLDEARRLYVRVTVPELRPTEAIKARVYVRQGRLAKAVDWVRERGLSVEDELCYLCEFEHLTLARVLIAEADRDLAERAILQALGLLERILKAAEESGRKGSVLETLVLQALAHQAQGNIPDDPASLERALAPLERALVLAEPEGYVRIFVDEGPPMAALLREAAKQGTAPDYVRQLRAAFVKTAGRPPVTQPLIEPLSKRERTVMGLLGTESSGPEIARELGVSLTTIRTHTQNIYGKLGVNNRRAAVRRAEELDLL